MNARLREEIRLLYKVEADYKIPATPVIRQLIADNERRLPDALPPRPSYVEFEWPKSGEVNFEYYWKSYDWDAHRRMQG